MNVPMEYLPQHQRLMGLRWLGHGSSCCRLYQNWTVGWFVDHFAGESELILVWGWIGVGLDSSWRC